MFCSQCQSDQIQKLSLVFKSGFSRIQSRSTGAGFGMGGIGIGAANTKGTQLTATAAEAAPPQPQPLMWPVLSMIVFALIGLGATTHIWLAVAAIAAVITFNRAKYNREIYPNLYAKWDQSYLCMRCGAMMIPNNRAPQLVNERQPAVETIDQRGIVARPSLAEPETAG